MNQNKRNKIQLQNKIQGSYRKKKRELLDDMELMDDYSDIDDDFNDNNIAKNIVRICVVIGIILVVIDLLFKEF